MKKIKVIKFNCNKITKDQRELLDILLKQKDYKIILKGARL